MNFKIEKENKRLASLKRLQIMDTAAEKDFDAVVELISEICDTPIALISLLDDKRQWFKARVGLEAQETSRDIAFCAHAILQDEIFIVQDALKDDRFKNNPLVTGHPNIRFYAGFPLKSIDGENLGTLCVIDKKSKELNEKQIKSLKLLANQIVNLFELRILLKESAERIIQDQIKNNVEASNAKSDFLSKMSHEIRTPINGIVGLTDLLLGSELSNEQRVRAELVKLCSEDLLNMMNDILDFSSMDEGKLNLEPRYFSIENLISDISSGLSHLAKRKRLLLSRKLAADLPDMIYCDPVRLRQILAHLVGNAIKFTEKGQISIRCEVIKKASDEQALRFEVEDTGIGISLEAQERLFSSFTQVDNSISRKFGGVGLGLAISKELVGLMKGQVGVQSQLGKGSLFWFEIPFDRSDRKITKKVSSLKILIAEDNSVNQLVAVNIVESLGHQADAVSNGVQALSALKNAKYDLILMDCLMPELGGCEATRRIRASLGSSYSNIPIIAMTANSMTGDELTWHNSGMNACISKPIDENKLEKLIAEFVIQKAS